MEFVKCPTCKINIPATDVEMYEKSGKCPLGCAFQSGAHDTDGTKRSGDSQRAIAGQRAACVTRKTVPAVKPVQRKWLQMEGRNATPYYHNTETGEDVWAKVRRPPVFFFFFFFLSRTPAGRFRQGVHAKQYHPVAELWRCSESGDPRRGDGARGNTSRNPSARAG